MKEKLLGMGYKIWSKKEGENRIYINDIMNYLTVTKTEKSRSQTEIDIFHDTIEDITLANMNLYNARNIKSYLEHNLVKLYYSVEDGHFYWRNDIHLKVLDNLVKIAIERIRNK